jgi:choline kinase
MPAGRSPPCRAVILAAGQGRRLGRNFPAKALLPFDGKTLLARHIAILEASGVPEIAVIVGHQAQQVRQEVTRLGCADRVVLIDNPAFREGSIVSLWCAREILRSGQSILLMDADVLYDRRLMARLLGSRHDDCFLLDREIEPGEEPVKLCVSQGRIVDFSKRPQIPHQWHGESVGFFRFSPEIAAELADRLETYLAEARTGAEYEEPIRDMLLARGGNGFGFEDVTGLPWIEIDFADDFRRAETTVLPELIA